MAKSIKHFDLATCEWIMSAKGQERQRRIAWAYYYADFEKRYRDVRHQ